MMAKKVRVNRTVCTECGEDLIPSSQYCHGCGASISIAASSVSEVESLEYIEDLPGRASHLFWLDGLLFTSAWYIPVIVMSLVVFSLLLAFLPESLHEFAIVSVAPAPGVLAAWFFIRARRRNQAKSR